MRMIANAICELDVANVTGPYCIPSIVLNMCSSELSPVIAILLEISFVVLAYKNNGERSDPGNYRIICK